MQDVRLGVDVGGMNTDAVVIDGRGHVPASAKTPTTPDVTTGIVQAIDLVLAAGVPIGKINVAMLGTMQCINAILEQEHLGRVGVVRLGAPATLAIPEWLLGTSVQKKTDLTTPITLFPWHGTRWKDKANLFISLDGEKKTRSGKTNRCVLAACAQESERDAGERSSFEGILTNDDDTLAHIDSLMKGRCSWLRFKPPFGSHGAIRLRSVP